MSCVDYYSVLEVPATASFEQIKQAYYSLAKKYHPDINPKTANLFRKINEAYQVLSNPLTRKEYDKTITTDNTVNEESFFDNLSKDALKEYLASLQRQNAELQEFLNKLKETSDTEEDEPCSDYFKNSRYYQDPHKEPIFNIIYNFKKFRFENAISSIWDRNVLSLLGSFIVFLFASILIVFSNLLFLRPKERKEYSFKWVEHIQYLLYSNRIMLTFSWTIVLLMLSTVKLVTTILYGVYWLFKNIVRYFLIPAAILAATILRYLPLFLLGGRK